MEGNTTARKRRNDPHISDLAILLCCCMIFLRTNPDFWFAAKPDALAHYCSLSAQENAAGNKEGIEIQIK